VFPGKPVVALVAFVACAGLASIGCGSSDEGGPTTTPTANDPGTTPDHVTVPTCGVGQMARAGSTTCVAVGGAVPEGFEAAADGAWGFRAIVSPKPCLGLERAAIGSATCKPIDDCNAPFPPADAKLVVSATDLTLAAALAIAGDGDTIAIDEGTYPSIVLNRDVNLVGRCASKVIFQAAGTAKENGIGVDGGHKVSVKSVTFRGFEFGIWAGGSGTSATVESSIFEMGGAAAWVISGATLDFRTSLVTSAGTTRDKLVDGIIVARGGKATVADSEFRYLHVALDAFGVGSQLTASHLVVSERSPELLSPLVVASEGAKVDVDSSRFEAFNSYLGGAKALDDRDPKGNTPAKLHIEKSELVRTNPTDASGFDVFGGSTLELVESTLAYRARVAVSAEEASNVSFVRSVVRPVSKDDAKNRVVGAAFVVNDGVRLSLEGSAIVGSSQSAILASRGCQIGLTSSLIADTWEYTRKDFSKRFTSGQAISLSGNATLELTDSTLANNAGVAIWMGAEKSHVRMGRSAVLATGSITDATAVAGLFALSGALEITDSLFHGMPDTALSLSGVTGVVARTVFSKSDVGFRVVTGSTLVEDKDEARVPEEGEVITRSNVLVDIVTPESADELPLGDCKCAAPPK
jgi:hypothetical protein